MQTKNIFDSQIKNKKQTKKELGRKYLELRSDIKSYTNDNYDDQLTFEYILQTYVPVKVLKVWIIRAKEELKEYEQTTKGE